MKINSKTKISEIIKENPDSIDTIATINKHFKKLNNPILRKVLATRVTVADAAKIGGVTTELVLDRLSSIGFEIDNKEPTKSNKDNKFHVESFVNKNIVELDARIDLENGNDPFKSIMTAINNLSDNEVLKVTNTFEPLPLIKVLSEKGFDHKVERTEDNLVLTYFSKNEIKGIKTEFPTELIEDDPELFDEIFLKFKKKVKEVDVRDLEMPLPMVTILSEIEVLPEKTVLFVHHKRIPQFLLSELDERGYNLIGKKLDDTNTKLLIYKK